jgi:hypothetical protein
LIAFSVASSDGVIGFWVAFTPAHALYAVHQITNLGGCWSWCRCAGHRMRGSSSCDGGVRGFRGLFPLLIVACDRLKHSVVVDLIVHEIVYAHHGVRQSGSSLVVMVVVTVMSCVSQSAVLSQQVRVVVE